MIDQKAFVNPKLAAMAVAMPARAAATPAAQPKFILQPQQFHSAPPHVIFFLNGPVIGDNNAAALDDRYNSSLKWYFPEFSLKEPLTDSFVLKCRQSGVDINAKPTYAGEATFTVSKTRPASIAAVAQTPGITCREIPLQNLTMTFVVTLFDNSTLPYPAKLVQQGDDYLLTIELASQQSLTSFYKFISKPANKQYCALSIAGGFLGYLPPPVRPAQFSNYQAAFAASHMQNLQLAHAAGMQTPVAPTLHQSVATAGQEPIAIAVHYPIAPPAATVPAQTYEVKSGIPFSQTIAGVNFDCHSYPQSYVISSSDSEAVTAFGCKPPFGDTAAQQFVYETFNLNKGSLSAKDYGINRIYLNTYNGSYMVVPECYVIAFDHAADEHLLTPAAHLYTSIDLKDAQGVDNSRATFQFGIAPDISEYQLLLIKQLILDNLPASPTKSIDDILVTFPEKIDNPDKVIFDPVPIPTVLISPLGTYRSGVLGSQYYDLQFQNVSIGQGHAEWIAQQVKRSAGFASPLTTTLTFDVDADSEQTPQSTIALSLARVRGSGLSLYADAGGSVTLANRTLYDISVIAYESAKAAVETPFAEPLLVPANGTVGFPADVSPAICHYTFTANPDYLNQVLKEIRVVDLDRISDDVIVTNNTGLFALYKIASIDFVISLITPGETDPSKALAVASTAIIKDGVINHVPFSLPVAQYLSHYSAVYSTVVNFRNGTQQANPATLIEDLNSIGKLINLTVGKLNLPKLETD